MPSIGTYALVQSMAINGDAPARSDSMALCVACSPDGFVVMAGCSDSKVRTFSQDTAGLRRAVQVSTISLPKGDYFGWWHTTPASSDSEREVKDVSHQQNVGRKRCKVTTGAAEAESLGHEEHEHEEAELTCPHFLGALITRN